MSIRVVRAVLEFKTPHGDLKKGVNWSHYETKALLTTSTTPDDAFDKFLRHGKRIIGSSIIDLMYLDSISFYEEIRDEGKIFYMKGRETKTIQIIKDNNEIVMFKVKQ